MSCYIALYYSIDIYYNISNVQCIDIQTYTYQV